MRRQLKADNNMSKWAESMKQRSYSYRKSYRVDAPLKKIISFVSEGNNDLFGRGDKMLLECGHEVYTKATYKARCIYCKKLNDEQNVQASVATDDDSSNAV